MAAATTGRAEDSAPVMLATSVDQLRLLLREELQVIGEEQTAQIMLRLDETSKSLNALHSLMRDHALAESKVSGNTEASRRPEEGSNCIQDAPSVEPLHGLSRIAVLLKEEEADLEDLDHHEKAHAKSAIRHVHMPEIPHQNDSCLDEHTGIESIRSSNTSTSSESSLAVPLVKGSHETVRQQKIYSNHAMMASGRRHAEVSNHHKAHVPPAGMCRRLVESPPFIKLIGAAIVANSLMIGVEVQYTASHLNTKLPNVFYVSEVVFCAVFVVDIVMRLLAFKCAFFYMRDWAWNLFDFIVVLMQFLENALSVTSLYMGETSVLNFVEESDSISLLNMLRMVRMLRILRLARMIKFVGELKEIVVAIASCMRALGWTVALLTFLIYMLGVALTQAVADHLEGASLGQKVEARAFFGSLDASMLSLFQCITDGVEWREVVRALSDVSPLLSFLFVLYIAFAAFALLNMLTAIIVENALESGKHHRRQFLLQEVRAVFAGEGDQENGKFKITWEDFAAHLKDPHLIHVLEAIDICEDTAHDLFELLDTKEEGAIEVDEFVNGCLALNGNAKAFDLAQLMHESRIHTKKWINESHFVNTALGEISNAMISLERRTL